MVNLADGPRAPLDSYASKSRGYTTTVSFFAARVIPV